MFDVWANSKKMLGLALVATLTGLVVGALTTFALPAVGNWLLAIGAPAGMLANLEWAVGTTALFFGISGGIGAIVTEGESEIAQAWKEHHPAKQITGTLVEKAAAQEVSPYMPAKKADEPTTMIAGCESCSMLAPGAEHGLAAHR